MKALDPTLSRTRTLSLTGTAINAIQLLAIGKNGEKQVSLKMYDDKIMTLKRLGLFVRKLVDDAGAQGGGGGGITETLQFYRDESFVFAEGEEDEANERAWEAAARCCSNIDLLVCFASDRHKCRRNPTRQRRHEGGNLPEFVECNYSKDKFRRINKNWESREPLLARELQQVSEVPDRQDCGTVATTTWTTAGSRRNAQQKILTSLATERLYLALQRFSIALTAGAFALLEASVERGKGGDTSFLNATYCTGLFLLATNAAVTFLAPLYVRSTNDWLYGQERKTGVLKCDVISPWLVIVASGVLVAFVVQGEGLLG